MTQLDEPVTGQQRAADALAAQGLSWQDLRTTLGAGDADPILITGSLTLPFPVPSDDIDVVLITGSESAWTQWAGRRDQERLSEQEANHFALAYLQAPAGELDVEVWPSSVVANAIAAAPVGVAPVEAIERDFTRFAGLERKVGVDLFHALWRGVPDPNAGVALARFTDGLDWSGYFAWNRDVHLINVRDAIKGIARSCRDNRYDEAYLKACWAADNVVDGLIFHHGHSMARWKWRLRHLDVLPIGLSGWYRTVRFGGLPTSRRTFDEWIDVLREVLEAHLGATPVPQGRLA